LEKVFERLELHVKKIRIIYNWLNGREIDSFGCLFISQSFKDLVLNRRINPVVNFFL
tara:strand:- start:1902 stop:2072 length:171 start_codon:yes stop_codon:yes gene_type:complete